MNRSIVIIMLCLGWTGASAGTYSGGAGTAENPYAIGSVADWRELTAATADWNGQFVLTADIDLAGVALTPVGTDAVRFGGVFDGKGHIVRNATIHLPDSDFVGLFGGLGPGSKIVNLGLENVTIQGRTFVGGLAGFHGASGSIATCYATGSVQGTGDIGGLVGSNNGSVTDCYTTASVAGIHAVGGLVGSHSGSVDSCYSMGLVSGAASDIGGLVGSNDGDITASFWDIQTSSRTTSAGGTGKTTLEMRARSTFTGAGWDFVGETANGTADAWRLCVDGAGYPCLAWESSVRGDFDCPGGVSLEDLLYLSDRWLSATPNAAGAADANLDGKIDLSDLGILAGNWKKEDPWNPPAGPVASFSRASIAFQDAVEYPVDARRQRTVAMVSTSDGAIPAAEGISGRHIRPCCHNGSYLFGIDTSVSRLYKSTDGVTWDQAGLYSKAITGDLRALSDGTLVGFVSPGSFPDFTGTAAVENEGGQARLKKTGAFASHTTGEIVYINFAASYPNGFYTIYILDNDNALFHTMANADVAYAGTDTTCTWQWASGVTNSSGKPLITKTNAFLGAMTGAEIYCAFAAGNYPNGYYKIVRVSANSVTLQTTANPGVDIVFTNPDSCVFVLCASCLTSSDNGATFTISHFLPSMSFDAYPASYPAIPSWAFHQQGNTIICGEYGMPRALGGRYLHRSTDRGATWTVVADLNDLSPKGYHWHTVGYHAATGKWLATFGDGGAVTGILVSADDGVTWTLLIGAGNCTGQPIAFLDTGDPTRILAGFDSSSCVGWIDMTTGRLESVFDATDHRGGRYYCFTLCKVGGVYYAGGFDDQPYQAPVLWVSTDLANWSVYHKFTDADNVKGFAARYVGFTGGKLHFLIQTTDVTHSLTYSRHLAISPAQVRAVGGTMIAGATTNLRNTEDLSSFETGLDLTSSTMTLSRVTDSFLGGYAAKAVRNDTVLGNHFIRSGIITLNRRSKYVFQCRMKASRPVRVTLKWDPGFTGYAISEDSDWTVDTTWRQCWSDYIPIFNLDQNNKIVWVVSKLNEPIELYIDAMQLQELPLTEFQIGGTPQAADVLTAVVAVPSAWTDLFAVQTIGQERHYTAAGNLSIKTWKTDADNFICLYYTVTDSRFTLQRTIAGVAQTAVRSSAQEWHPNQVIKFALRADGSGLALSIQSGRAIETIADGVAAAQLSAPITMIYGDALWAGQFPGTYVDGTMPGTSSAGVGFFPFRLTDGDIAAAFNLTVTAGAAATGG